MKCYRYHYRLIHRIKNMQPILLKGNRTCYRVLLLELTAHKGGRCCKSQGKVIALRQGSKKHPGMF